MVHPHAAQKSVDQHPEVDGRAAGTQANRQTDKNHTHKHKHKHLRERTHTYTHAHTYMHMHTCTHSKRHNERAHIHTYTHTNTDISPPVDNLNCAYDRKSLVCSKRRLTLNDNNQRIISTAHIHAGDRDGAPPGDDLRQRLAVLFHR